MSDPSQVRRSDRFEVARPRLVGVAYRVLGSTLDAEDVVQEAWLRWRAADHDVIDNPDAWLTTVVTRLAIDRLRRRKREQEHYVGPWLPVPLVERAGDPAASAELADSMTTAFLLLLERLSPDERAAFLLADVFGEPFGVVARAMDRSEEACRQLASRARRKLRDDERRPPADRGAAARDVVDRFLVAVAVGDEDAALACVAGDAVWLSDGGPHRRAARRPVVGPRRIVRLATVLTHRLPPTFTAEPATVGGLPGVVVRDGRDGTFMTIGFEVRDDRITRAFAVVNPEKLAGVHVDPGSIR